MNSGFIIYNRDFFIDSMESLRDTVCEKVCYLNQLDESDCEFYCDECPFIKLINDFLAE